MTEKNIEQQVPFNIDLAEQLINNLVDAVNALNDRVEYLEERFYMHEHNANNDVVLKVNYGRKS